MKASGSHCPLDTLSIIPFKRCPYLRSYVTEIICLICTALIHKKGETSDPKGDTSLAITLLHLKNSFGEIHHNLIPEVLRYHHIPQHIPNMVQSLYCNFHTSILTTSYETPFLKVGKSVLQGDCLSPLTFNLSFNTFSKYISDPMFTQFGFTTSTLSPLHWFQFADDAAVVTGNEQEKKTLLYRFTRWCAWAKMVIKVDKCVSFRIKKSTSSTQFLPRPIINRKLVPVVNLGESFK